MHPSNDDDLHTLSGSLSVPAGDEEVFEIDEETLRKLMELLGSDE